MQPTNNFPTHSVDTLVNSVRHINNRVDQTPISVNNTPQDIRFLSSPYNSPPQMFTPRLDTSQALKGISQLHSRLDEMLKNSSNKTQYVEQASNIERTSLSNNILQREQQITRPGSIQPSYRSEVLEKFSQVPTSVSGFPLSPKLDFFPPFSGAETPFHPNSAPLYDRSKLDHILSNIKTRDVVHPVQSPQLQIDPNSGFQGHPQPHIQSVMSPYARSEFNMPQMNPYAQVPNVHPGFAPPKGFPQNIPQQHPQFQPHHQEYQQHPEYQQQYQQHPQSPQYQQHQQLPEYQQQYQQHPQSPQYQQYSQYQQQPEYQENEQHGHFYHPGMVQSNQIQSPHQIPSPGIQYVENPHYQAPQMEQQMRAPYAEPRGHPQVDPRMYQQVPQGYQNMQVPPQIYERGIPEEFGELEADEEEEYSEIQQQSRRQVMGYEPQQEVQHGFRSGNNKRKLQARQQEDGQRQERDGAFWGQVQNDDDSLIMKHHPTRQEPARRDTRQNNENRFGDLEDDSTEFKPVAKAQPKQKTNKRERSRRRGTKKEERIIPDDIFTETVVGQGPQVEGKVSRARRNSRKRFPLFKGEEQTQTPTHAQAVESVNLVVASPVQSFGQEFRSGGNVSKKGSPEKAGRTPKVGESVDFQLKERSPYKNNQVLAELERGLEISTSEIRKLHQDTLNQFEILSDFVFKGNNGERESPNDSITKAFEQAKCQSPFKLSPQKVQVKEIVAKKTEMVFKSKDSRRRLVR